jgi:very-short-patch-repair endonuclease
MTGGERLLWQRLRGEQLGIKFRRQHPVGSYIADFACLAPQLIVEIDGSHHVGQQAYDAKRDAYFKSLGFDVLRFPANVPFSDLPSMVQAIYNRLIELHPTLPLSPSPSGGRRGWGPPADDSKPAIDSSAAGPHPNLPPEGEGA